MKIHSKSLGISRDWAGGGVAEGATMKEIKIKHPEWLEYSKPQSSIDLFRKGFLPGNIAGWMIVVGLKHPLRAVYGSDLRAALALLWWVIWEPIKDKFLALKYRKEVAAWEKEWAAEDEARDMRRAAVKN